MLRKTLIFASMLSPLLWVSPETAANALAIAPAQQQQTQTVNLNTATANQIAMVLTGVGTKRAEAIVALRDKLGAFTDINQLMQIKGIGPRLIELNKDRMKLND